VSRRIKTIIAVFLLAAGIFGIWSIVDASSTGKQIVACANKKNGQMRLLRSGKCTTQENEVRWNENGPTGPTGVQGPAGVQGPQGAAGPQGPAATLPPKRVPTQRVGDLVDGNAVVFFVDTDDEYDFDYLAASNTLEIVNATGCSFSPEFTSSPSIDAFNTSEAFGAGRSNTLTLLAACATELANPSQYWSMRNSIKAGWFVPSVAELKHLYITELSGDITLSQKTWEMESSIMSSSMAQSGTTPNFWGLRFFGVGTGGAVKWAIANQRVRLIRAG
jgi:hypothetical protein